MAKPPFQIPQQPHNTSPPETKQNVFMKPKQSNLKLTRKSIDKLGKYPNFKGGEKMIKMQKNYRKLVSKIEKWKIQKRITLGPQPLFSLQSMDFSPEKVTEKWRKKETKKSDWLEMEM